MKQKVLFGLSICLVFGSLHCRLLREKSPSFWIEKELIVSGETRSYTIIPPESWDGRPKPTLIALHGGFGTGKHMAKNNKLVETFQPMGYTCIFPNGVARSWADGRGATSADGRGIDDVTFIIRLVEELTKAGYSDPTRIHLVGHSNGGFMAQRLALEQPKLWKSVTSVSSFVSVSLAKQRKQGPPVSMAIFAGVLDPLVPFSGGYVSGGGEILSAFDSLYIWRDRNECTSEPSVMKRNLSDKNQSIEMYSFAKCKENTNVRLYKMNGIGHKWPGSSTWIPFINQGPEVNDYDISKELLDWVQTNER